MIKCPEVLDAGATRTSVVGTLTRMQLASACLDTAE